MMARAATLTRPRPGATMGAMLPPPPSAGKAAWRRWAHDLRAAARDPAADAAVVAALAAWPPLREARVVLGYLAFGSELDLAPLFVGRTVLVPRSHERPAPRLTLHRLEPGRIERHRWGMLEPPRDAPEVDPAEVDVALVPGLAFDRRGARLGYGRGFFDRLLPRLRPDALRVGVAREALVAPRLPCEPHDVAMTHLATEAGVRPVAAG